MPRPLNWNFLKVVLQGELQFSQRQQILVERFLNADTFTREWRDVEYRYQLYDLGRFSIEGGRDAVFGRLTRSPKLAYGRALHWDTRESEEDTRNIDDIADATEFIYDLTSCVLALHRRAPFTSMTMNAKVFAALLGQPFDRNSGEMDVHVQVLRDSEFTETMLDSSDNLKEVKLVFAKPNPGSGDNILSQIHLGLIAEQTDSDQISFDAKKKSAGSLDKKGFLRRSIISLLENGYMKAGHIFLGDRRINLLEASEKQASSPESVGEFWLGQMSKVVV